MPNANARLRLIPWIAATLALTAAADPAPTTRPYCEAGFAPIFNGQDLTGWVYGTKDNGMKQGAGYHVDPAQGVVFSTIQDGGNLYTEKEYANFILRLEFKLTE